MSVAPFAASLSMCHDRCSDVRILHFCNPVLLSTHSNFGIGSKKKPSQRREEPSEFSWYLSKDNHHRKPFFVGCFVFPERAFFCLACRSFVNSKTLPSAKAVLEEKLEIELADFADVVHHGDGSAFSADIQLLAQLIWPPPLCDSVKHLEGLIVGTENWLNWLNFCCTTTGI